MINMHNVSTAVDRSVQGLLIYNSPQLYMAHPSIWGQVSKFIPKVNGCRNKPYEPLLQLRHGSLTSMLLRDRVGNLAGD